MEYFIMGNGNNVLTEKQSQKANKILNIRINQYIKDIDELLRIASQNGEIVGGITLFSYLHQLISIH